MSVVVACSESNICNFGSHRFQCQSEPWATGNASGKALAALARDRAKAERAERAGRGRRHLSQILVPVGLSENKVYLLILITSKPNDGLFSLVGGLEHGFYFPFRIWDVILPIGKLITHFAGSENSILGNFQKDRKVFPRCYIPSGYLT